MEKSCCESRPMVLATLLFGWLVAGGALVNGAIGDWWD